MLLRFIHYTYMVEHQMKGAKNMSEIQNAIEVKNLKKGFGGRVLFENFSLNVKANTIHAIIGPNGSGKTTLLRLITGVYQPNAGTINIAGKYAMQLENDYLYEEQTGLENLRIFGKYFGFEINDRSDSYCTQLGLTEHLGKRVISKGHKSTTPPLLDPLTDREAEIIKAIGTGKTKHEIAQELYISERTLYNHIQSIYDKLGAKNAIEAYNKAIALGYITPLI